MCRSAIVSVVILLSAAGCTNTRWRYDDPVPYGPGHSVTRERLVATAEGDCPARDRLGTAFASDGCSALPEGDVGGCCVAHDLAYWCGGSARARRLADRALRECVAETGGSARAWLMYWGVRLGGHPASPFPWRWGFGRRWRGLYWSEPGRPLALDPAEDEGPGDLESGR